MGEPNKKGGKKGGKAGVVLLVLLLVVGGVAALGYFKPDTPYIGPFIGSLIKTTNQATSGAGTYEVRIDELKLDAAEFKEGDELDLQLLVFKADATGKLVGQPMVDTNKWGTNLRKVGKDAIVANWSGNPITLDWNLGERYAIEVWTKKGANRKLAEWMSAADPKAFPLSGSVYFEKIEGRDPKSPKANSIAFSAKPK